MGLIVSVVCAEQAHPRPPLSSLRARARSAEPALGALSLRASSSFPDAHSGDRAPRGKLLENSCSATAHEPPPSARNPSRGDDSSSVLYSTGANRAASGSLYIHILQTRWFTALPGYRTESAGFCFFFFGKILLVVANKGWILFLFQNVTRDLTNFSKRKPAGWRLYWWPKFRIRLGFWRTFPCSLSGALDSFVSIMSIHLPNRAEGLRSTARWWFIYIDIRCVSVWTWMHANGFSSRENAQSLFQPSLLWPIAQAEESFENVSTFSICRCGVAMTLDRAMILVFLASTFVTQLDRHSV